MSKKHGDPADAASARNAAAAAQTEDPMTSLDPEADKAKAEADQDSESVPAERAPRGNGSRRAAQAPGEPPAPEGDGPASAAPGEHAAEPAEPGPSELELAHQEAAQNYDRLLRLQAEFENTKRRVAKEHQEALRYALSPLVKELAVIMDHLELAVAHARKDAGGGEALLAGVEMVLKQMGESLARFGVTRIEAVGRPFDPVRHEAINVVATDAVPENQVLEEYQAGYLLHDRVIRPARVSVSKRSGEAGGQAPPPGS